MNVFSKPPGQENRDEKNHPLPKEDGPRKTASTNRINNSPYEQNKNPPDYVFPKYGPHGKEHLPTGLDFLVRARRCRFFCHRHRQRTQDSLKLVSRYRNLPSVSRRRRSSTLP